MVTSTILLLILSISSAKGAERRGDRIVLPVIDKYDIRFVTGPGVGEELNKWITGITQDNQGFLWFATSEGLFRYDGYALTRYLHDPGNPNSIDSDTLSAIYKDRSGILWIGTYNAGLDRLDRQHARSQS